MRQKRRASTSVLYYLLAGVLALIFLLPFLIMVFGSLDGETKYSITLTNWFPAEFSLRTYQNVLSLGSDMSRWFLNSAHHVSHSNAVRAVHLSAVGLHLRKKAVRGKNIVFWYFMIAIMVPYQATIVSNYLVYNHLAGSTPTGCS